jgi:hypothetical protein
VTALSGLALFLAIVATRYRDLPPIVNAALTVAFYITPVIWIKESLGNNELVNTLVSLKVPNRSTNWPMRKTMLRVTLILVKKPSMLACPFN